MAKEARIFSERKRDSSLNCVGKTGKLHAKESNGLLSHTMHKMNSKWIKDLNVTPETIKLLEENTGSMPFEINVSNITNSSTTAKNFFIAVTPLQIFLI